MGATMVFMASPCSRVGAAGRCRVGTGSSRGLGAACARRRLQQRVRAAEDDALPAPDDGVLSILEAQLTRELSRPVLPL